MGTAPITDDLPEEAFKGRLGRYVQEIIRDW
jgi:hypothetical protein